MARSLGKRQSVVWGWAASGRVPSKRIPEIIAAAARLDPPVHLTPNDFFDVAAAVGSAPTSGAPPSSAEPAQVGA